MPAYDPAAAVLMIEVHGWADPEAGTGDQLVGYLAAEPINRGIDATKRWADPVPVGQAGRWDRAEALELAGAYNRVHKWGQRHRRRWAVTVPAGQPDSSSSTSSASGNGSSSASPSTEGASPM